MTPSTWDWYAGQALAGLLAYSGPYEFKEQQQLEQAACDMADRMVAESARRSKKQQTLCDREECEALPADGLFNWCVWWNGLADDGLVSVKVNVDRPNEAVRTRWSQLRKNARLRELLSDPDLIARRIRESELCREGWFRLEKLLGGKNKDGAYIVEVLLDGGYKTRGARDAADPFAEFARGA